MGVLRDTGIARLNISIVLPLGLLRDDNYSLASLSLTQKADIVIDLLHRFICIVYREVG